MTAWGDVRQRPGNNWMTTHQPCDLGHITAAPRASVSSSHKMGTVSKSFSLQLESTYANLGAHPKDPEFPSWV